MQFVLFNSWRTPYHCHWIIHWYWFRVGSWEIDSWYCQCLLRIVGTYSGNTAIPATSSLGPRDMEHNE